MANMFSFEVHVFVSAASRGCRGGVLDVKLHAYPLHSTHVLPRPTCIAQVEVTLRRPLKGSRKVADFQEIRKPSTADLATKRWTKKNPESRTQNPEP